MEVKEAKKAIFDNLPLIIVGIIAVIVLGMFTRGQNITIEQPNQNYDSISVTGESSEYVAPDTASVNFSLTRKSKTVGEATESVNVRIKELMTALAATGVAEGDIKTTSYSVSPEYTYPERGGQQFDGYRVSQAVDIKIKDLKNVEKVLGLINGAQVDYVSGLTFSIDDDTEVRKKVRAEAISLAKVKANDLEQQLGVKLDTIIGFYEDTGSWNPQPYYSYGREAMSSDVATSPTIPAGENEVKSIVTITYRINDDKK